MKRGGEMTENKGWDYLNSRDEGGDSYHDSDGSWGYKNSDGSASFHGADGSWGYRESDGSVSFHGSDGSWGYRNSDGSGSYYGSSGDTRYFNARSDNGNGENEDMTESSSHSFGEAIGAIIGAGLAASVALEAQEKAERRERASVRASKRRAWAKKHWKGITITIFVIIVFMLAIWVYHEYKLLTPMGCSSASLEGLKYSDAVQKLKESGFIHVRTKEISDLTLSREDEENLVSEVRLIHTDTFNESTVYPSNFWVTVVYHTVELYAPPITSKDAKGMNYQDVLEEFENAGFVNVSTEVEYDIITGWLSDDGEVKSVTINGEKKYDYYDEFRLDAEVVITYHTLRSNKPD